jgi:hypothetical protein
MSVGVMEDYKLRDLQKSTTTFYASLIFFFPPLVAKEWAITYSKWT